FSNGKRFRPLLSLLTAKALNHSQEEVLPLAAAVELIHTYSLVHDDLPLMDNDDLRRGMPTNHKVFGEAMALLAGDGLLTLAFYVIAKGLAG
ncbi:polyprenyl synthetase family protein, partial [Klebsiella pneumoniae]|uniref:polyprenyl synthetase family protein n=1 Tax=Klebsiella pneumoniae TaxID=573 RepID=UPI003B9805FC